ncbi:MAG: hypothetical protein WC047_08600, partial [Kiritimatiellales bacterium]
VQEGESQGQVQTDFDNLETEDNLFWLQSKLAKLGYELPEDIDELPEILEDIETNKPIVRCKVVCKDDFTHVYMNKVVEESGGQTKAELNGEDEPAKKKGKVEKKTEPAPEPEKTTRRKKGAAAAVELEVGDMVSFVEEGETFTGKITAINDESADVEVDDTDEIWDVELSDLTKVEKEEEPSKKKETVRKAKAATIEVGSAVTFTDGDDEYAGEVTEIDGDSADVQVDDDVYEVALSDLTLSE